MIDDSKGNREPSVCECILVGGATDVEFLVSSFVQRKALDAAGAASGFVNVKGDAAEADVVLPDLHAFVEAGEEAFEHGPLVVADDGVVGAGHSHVGDEGGAAGQDFFVGGGDVGVGANDGGDAPVEIEAQRLLF